MKVSLHFVATYLYYAGLFVVAHMENISIAVDNRIVVRLATSSILPPFGRLCAESKLIHHTKSDTAASRLRVRYHINGNKELSCMLNMFHVITVSVPHLERGQSSSLKTE
jgi:hypothetical protein